MIILWELHVFLFLFLVMVVTLLFVNKSHERRVLIIGSISAIFSSFMHLTLLSELVSFARWICFYDFPIEKMGFHPNVLHWCLLGQAIAWKNYDVKFLHPLLSILAFLKGALWTTYGWNSSDWFILVSIIDSCIFSSHFI